MSSVHSRPQVLGQCQHVPRRLAAATLLLCKKHSMSLNLQVGPAAPLAAVLHVPEPSSQGLQASHTPAQESALESAGEADEWEIPYEELELGPRIGIGSFGEVRPTALAHMEDLDWQWWLCQFSSADCKL